jgi:hypothetical protein
MNLEPVLSLNLSVFMVLFSAAMWGSWAISLKYLRNYPLDGFFITVLTTSVVFVWTVGFILDGAALTQNVIEIYRLDPLRVVLTVASGMVYIQGVRLSLMVQKVIGLSLAQPIQSSIILLSGTVVSGLVGGIPEGASLGNILLGSLVLILAVTSGMFAGYYRSENHPTEGIQFSKGDLRQAIKYVILTSMLIPTYTFGLSFGLKSATHSQGLAVLPFMALLATGAFIGALISSGYVLTKRKQWRRVLSATIFIHSLGVTSGLFHYGGNVIHAFATAELSTVISWPLGLTGGLWTQLWGLVYGEFKGSGHRAYIALALAIVFYLVGAFLIANTLYQ